MSMPDDPSVPVHSGGTAPSRSPLLEQTSALPPSEEPSGGNGSAPPQEPRWQEELWRRVLRRPARALLAAIAVGLLAAIPGAAINAHGKTTYSSQTVLMLDDPLGIATSGDPGPLAKLDELRFKYASLAGTYAIAGPVASDLHVPVSTVLASTSVAVPANSLLMDVSGRASTPGFAQELSGAMAQGIANYIKTENTTYSIPSPDRFEATTVTPTSPAVASHPSKTRALAAGAVIFLVVGVVVFVGYQLLVSAEPAGRRRRR